MDNLVLVNKQNGIDINYVPNDLVICDNNENNFHNYVDPTVKPMVRKEVLYFFNILREEALKKGLIILVDSGFRTGSYQGVLWNYNFHNYFETIKKNNPELDNDSITKLAEDYTDKYVARPGHSEHQTGLAFDFARMINGVYDIEVENTPEAQWMRENAYKYGFILRYPKGKEEITGYNEEQWHYRYIGIPYSKEVYENNMVLEEYKEYVLKLKK